MKQIKGLPASTGIAIGPVFQFTKEEIQVKMELTTDARRDLDRMQTAREAAADQLRRLYEQARAQVGEENAAIFTAHLSMLEDPEYLQMVTAKIEQENLSAERAVWEATEHYAGVLARMEGEYFKARAADIRDVGHRLIAALQGRQYNAPGNILQPSVIVARDLTPSDTVLLDKSRVLGFCTIEGGDTSHTAILARGLGLPAIVGCDPRALEIPNGGQVVLDGTRGILISEPGAADLNAYRKQIDALQVMQHEIIEKCHLPAVSLDGFQVEVAANIGNLQGAKKAVSFGAEGVGLFRTEFLYLERQTLPGEEEQYEAYASILNEFGMLPVVLRTSDIGGDKELPYLNLPAEANPFLGVRGLRLCLLHPEIFKPQIKAALRAGMGHRLRIMYPMVSTVEEIEQAKALVEECKTEMRLEGKLFADNVEFGIMVEIPSTAVAADLFAPLVDFFSIGTNDLTQYTLAADRTNPHLSAIASAFHPSVLRLIQQVIRAAHAEGKWVGVCGELGGEPLAIPVLFGMGLDEFSMNPTAIPAAKYIIRSIRKPEAEALTAEVLKLDTAQRVKETVLKRIKVPGILE